MALHEQDFLMRQIQYLTQVLQQIIFKKNKDQYQEAVEEIEDAFQRITKDYPKSFNELSLKETCDIFKINGQFQSELAGATADLLIEKADMLPQRLYSKSQKCRQQALLLYKKMLSDESAAVPLDISEKIQKLESSLTESQIYETDQLYK